MLESAPPTLEREAQHREEETVGLTEENSEKEIEDERRSSIEEVEMRLSDSETHITDQEVKADAEETFDPQGDVDMVETKTDVEPVQPTSTVGDGIATNDVDMVANDEVCRKFSPMWSRCGPIDPMKGLILLLRR